MSDINEVLDRLRRMFDLRLGLAPALVRPSDVRALLDDHARLQALIDGSPKGSSTAQRIELTNGQIAQLADFAGTPDPGTPMEDQDVLVILHWNNGHSGPGLYAYYGDLPEEGAIHLDGEVQP